VVGLAAALYLIAAGVAARPFTDAGRGLADTARNRPK
jgi:hypothetical protein